MQGGGLRVRTHTHTHAHAAAGASLRFAYGFATLAPPPATSGRGYAPPFRWLAPDAYGVLLQVKFCAEKSQKVLVIRKLFVPLPT